MAREASKLVKSVTRHGPKVTRRVINWMLSALVVASLTYVLLTRLAPTQYQPRAIPLWIPIGYVLGFVVIRVGLGRLSTKRFKQRANKPWSNETPGPARMAFVAAYQTLFGADEVPLEQFMSGLADPASNKVRLSRDAIVRSGYFELVDTHVMDLTPSGGLFPLLKVPKGLLVDQVQVEVDGADATVLGRSEALGAGLVTLEQMFLQVKLASVEAQQEWLHLRDKALLAAASSVPPHAEFVRNLVTRIEKCGATADDDEELVERRFTAADTTRFLSELHMVIVALRSTGDLPDARWTVTVRRRSRHGRKLQPVDRIRLWLGLELRKFRLQVNDALEYPSVHLNVSAPEGMYLYSAGPNPGGRYRAIPIAVDQEAYEIHRRPGGLTAAQIWVDDTFGLDHAHVNLHAFPGLSDATQSAKASRRDLGASAEDLERALGVEVVVEFRERPPGLVPMVVVAGMLQSSMLVLAWGHFSHVFGEDTSNLALSALYGLPLLIAGWLIAKADATAFARMSLPTLLSLVWVLANTAMGVLVISNVAVVDRTDPSSAWITLVYSSVSQVACGLYLYVVRQVRFARATRLGEPRGVRS